MWTYERRLEYPVKICKPDPNAAQLIISQLGGPNGELGASMRYLNQRYTMTDRNVAGCLTDIGTEELAHMEIIGAILHQLTRNLTIDQIEKSPFASYFVDHTAGVWPSAASGMPFSSASAAKSALRKYGFTISRSTSATSSPAARRLIAKFTDRFVFPLP